MKMTESGFKAMTMGYDYEVKYFHSLRGSEREICLGGNGHIALINADVPIIVIFENNGIQDKQTELYNVHAEIGEEWIDLPKFFLRNDNQDQYIPPGHWENAFSKYIRKIIQFLINKTILIN